VIGSGVNWHGIVEIYVTNVEISQDTRKRVLKQDFEQLKKFYTYSGLKRTQGPKEEVQYLTRTINARTTNHRSLLMTLGTTKKPATAKVVNAEVASIVAPVSSPCSKKPIALPGRWPVGGKGF
jgi:hypothetical protein